MKDEENKMQSAAPEQQAQPGTENEPKAETTAPETPDKKKRPLWLKLLAVFAAALAVLVNQRGGGIHVHDQKGRLVGLQGAHSGT